LGPGGDENNRLGVYDIYDPLYSSYRYPYLICGGIGAFYNPPVYGPPDKWNFVDSGPDDTKLCQIGGSSNHALTPPRSNGEWICFEHMFDLRRNRGNADGIHKVRMTWRDGTERELVYPLNWDEGWDFDAQYCYKFEGLGFYFNTAGTANANNYVIDCDPVFAANMDSDEWIGPPADWLE